MKGITGFASPLLIREAKIFPVTLRRHCRTTQSRWLRTRTRICSVSLLPDSISTEFPFDPTIAEEPSSPPSPLPPEPYSTPELENLQQQIPIFFHNLKKLHADLQMDTPPTSTEMVPIITPIQEASERLQAQLNRTFPGHRQFLEIVHNVHAPYCHPHLLAYLISLDGPIRNLIGAMQVGTASLLRRIELDVDVGDCAPEELVEAHAAFNRFFDIRHRNLAKLRNRYWKCVSWEGLRAHSKFYHLPMVGSRPIREARDLNSLRQDSEAFEKVRSGIPLLASSVWKVLGIGEDGGREALKDLVPRECKGHGHVLEVWKRMAGGRDVGDGFEEAFGMLHVPNGMVSYLEAMQEWFKGKGEVGYAPAVRVYEIGLVVTVLEAYGVVGCTAGGRVVRRIEEDYWGWSKVADGVVLAKTERVYWVNGAMAEFHVWKVRNKLDAVSFVDAQMTMLVCGEYVKWTDVVWHGVLGGMRTFRVKRDDEFLRIAGRFVGQFRESFIGKRPRPPGANFQAGELFDKIAERIKKGCEGAECVFEVHPVVDEMRVARWRRWTPEKFQKSNDKPFIRNYDEDGWD